MTSANTSSTRQTCQEQVWTSTGRPQGVRQGRRISIAGERLWSSLMEMAEIGKTPRGGCNRQALTDEDKQGRDLFVSWCRAAGCEITVDNMGNIFARRAGKNDSHPPVSGAGHDSVHVSSVAPTSMIFIPCEGGLSHNEAESAGKEDLEAGCNVLLHAILEMAAG